MKTLTIKVPDQKYSFFKELIKNLDFVKEVKTDEEPTKDQILDGLREAVEEVKAIKAGKKKVVLLKDFLMGYKIAAIATFRNEAKRLIKKYPSLEKELAALGEQLSSEPTLGTSIGMGAIRFDWR